MAFYSEEKSACDKASFVDVVVERITDYTKS